MEDKGGNIADEIIAVLTEEGVRTEAGDYGLFIEINASEVTFIVPCRMGRTMEEARVISETISVRLNALRRERKVMVVAVDLWRGQREMMVARILAHCGIFTRVFARNCELRRITRPEAATFLSKWHSYGTATCRHCYGLFIETIIAAAEFSNARKMVKNGMEIRSYEWVRYASLPDIRIDGGMGKILRKFIDDVNPDDIMSYADLEWSDGDAYKKLGFTEDGMRNPVMFTIDPLTMRRTPLSRSIKDTLSTIPQDISQKDVLYHQNFGSKKYRLVVSPDRIHHSL